MKENNWVILTDTNTQNPTDDFSLALKSKLEEAQIAFKIERDEDSEHEHYWLLVGNEHFDEAANRLQEVENTFSPHQEGNDVPPTWVKLTTYSYDVEPEG